MLIVIDQTLLLRFMESRLISMERRFPKFAHNVNQRDAIIEPQAQEPGFFQRLRSRDGRDCFPVVVSDVRIQIGGEVVGGGHPDRFPVRCWQK